MEQNYRIAFILFDGMTALDFVGAFDPLTRLKTMGFWPSLSWELCARTEIVRSTAGLELAATQVDQPLAGFDLLVIPGGQAAGKLQEDAEFLTWLRTAEEAPLKASVCTGALLLGAAGFLDERPAATHPGARDELRRYTDRVSLERVVDAGSVVTAGGVSAGIDLGLYLVERLAGDGVRRKIARQMDIPGAEDPAESAVLRRAHILRSTSETRIEVDLDLDGAGRHEIATGVGFLDHMLTHLAVHGLFDLGVRAEGDLHIDVHHTVEDVALALGEAFRQALGERRGLVRMASAYAPMDEALAFVAIDLSGRPYVRFEADWRSPEVGGVPTSLFPHFLESFAANARCNLHARLLTGRDDHHQAEALFKALARALQAAVEIDPRRAGTVPSTKGTLTE